jgi:hypothetical protein
MKSLVPHSGAAKCSSIMARLAVSTSEQLQTIQRTVYSPKSRQLFISRQDISPPKTLIFTVIVNCLAMKNYHDIHLRSSLFWDVTQPRFSVIYRRFGTTFRYHLQGSSNPRRIPEDVIDTLSRNVGNYQYTLRNTPAKISLTHRREPEITAFSTVKPLDRPIGYYPLPVIDISELITPF